MEGTVKFFNSQKGFGFITRDDGEKDLFFHISQLPEGIYLEGGERVGFDVGEGRKGPEGHNISVL